LIPLKRIRIKKAKPNEMIMQIKYTSMVSCTGVKDANVSIFLSSFKKRFLLLNKSLNEIDVNFHR